MSGLSRGASQLDEPNEAILRLLQQAGSRQFCDDGIVTV